MAATEAARAAGVSYRQLDHWVSSGLIACDEPNPGQGYRRMLEEDEARVLVLMGAMTRAGWQASKAVDVARELVAGRSVELWRLEGVALTVSLGSDP